MSQEGRFIRCLGSNDGSFFDVLSTWFSKAYQESNQHFFVSPGMEYDGVLRQILLGQKNARTRVTGGLGALQIAPADNRVNHVGTGVHSVGQGPP
jgi:hypothetical protein